MKLVPLRPDLEAYLRDRRLLIKWKKSAALFCANPRHPSLHVELLEPHWRGIYSFRIDKKYRALFFFRPDSEVEVFAVTNHYR